MSAMRVQIFLLILGGFCAQIARSQCNVTICPSFEGPLERAKDLGPPVVPMSVSLRVPYRLTQSGQTVRPPKTRAFLLVLRVLVTVIGIIGMDVNKTLPLWTFLIVVAATSIAM